MMPNNLLQKFISQYTGLRLDGRKLKEAETWLLSFLSKVSHSEVRNFFLTPDEKEKEDFWNLLTVGETYFFREDTQFQLLGEKASDWIKNGVNPITIWCAGCATGEEVYTLAMVLEKFSLDTFFLVGTDLNLKGIRQAKEGAYTQYSLRKVDKVTINQNFVREGLVYKVRERYKKNVQFFQLNLLSRPYPALLKNCHAIFCRNVFIYMEPWAIQQIIKYFSEMLVPEGLLFLGGSELLLSSFSDFVPADSPRVYRKVKKVKETDNVFTDDAFTSNALTNDTFTSSALTDDALADNTLIDNYTVQDIEKVINEQDSFHALKICHSLMSKYPDNAELHFYTGILMSQSSIEKGLDEFKKVLCLDPEHVMARYYMIEILEKLNKKDEAKENYLYLLENLKKLNEDEIIDPREGLTVGFFIKACEMGLSAREEIVK